ncbi:MAG TPA: hypothetical protein VIM41_11270, partial [Gammaproteobacteria bacterium]
KNIARKASEATRRRVLKQPDVDRVPDDSADFFVNEPQTDLEAQDEMSLLFTNIDVGKQARGATDLINAMSKDGKNDDELVPDKEPAVQSGWVSDQVMWETALGFRQDEKVQNIIVPDSGKAREQFFGRDVKQPEQPAEYKHDRPIFQGREINYQSINRSSNIPVVNRRRQIQALVQKAKILLWLSPLIVAIGYYFSLAEEERIALQLNVARFITGKSSGLDFDKDIAKDAEQLIKETEARINAETKTANAAKSAPAVKPTSNKPVVKTAPREQPAITNPNTFSGRDVPFRDQSRPVTAVQAPLPQPSGDATNFPQGGQPVLPPIPDAAPVIISTRITSTSASATSAVPAVPANAPPEGVVIKKVPDNVDVNAEQNTATFHKTQDGNLESIIAQ